MNNKQKRRDHLIRDYKNDDNGNTRFKRKDRIRNRVNDLGHDVLLTPEFQQTYDRPHHLKTTVAIHSIRVAGISLVLATFFSALGIKVDKRLLIIAALCHDFGMLNRDSYKNARETCRKHPVDAVPIVENALDLHDEKLNNAIEAHMYPLNRTRPCSLEAVLLILADKIGSVVDLFDRGG